MRKGSVERLRVVVLGYLVRGPLAGLAWHHLQYVHGLTRLGHDVFFLEDSDDYPSCYDPLHDAMGIDPTYGLAFATQAFAELGLGHGWAYHDAHSGRWCGEGAASAIDIASRADVLLNVSGVNPLRPWLQDIPVRALVDTDPVFTQVRHIQNPQARARAAEHTVFFSFAENLGRDGCGVPSDGFAWRPTRQPVVLDAWPVTPGQPAGPLTSVMLWGSYRSIRHNGRLYGMKAESFSPYVDLPLRRPDRWELAMGSEPGPRAELERHGWRVLDPREPTRDLHAYQTFIRRSKAEFSVAKHGYVVSRSGWFSERSAAYLASGRPVVVQDTGFSEWLCTDGGVLPFSTPEEALARLDDLNASYAYHCREARAVAEAYFDAEMVLSDLLEAAMTTCHTRALET